MDTDLELAEDEGARYPHSDLTQDIIGAAYEVYRELGYGFLEKVYAAALKKELEDRGREAVSEAQIEVHYKGEFVGVYFADIVVDKRVICEIKSAQKLAPEHEAQLLNYLKAAGIKVGLLLNFGPKGVQVKRMVF
jgi:GxxExxY protein